MHHQIFLIAAGSVVLGGKTGQTFFIDEAFELRCDLGNKDVYSQIEFLAVYQVGKTFVLLHHMWLIPRDVFDSACDEDAFALTGIDRLDDECHWLLLLLYEVHKVVGLCREAPSLGKEVEIAGHLLLHQLEVLSQVVL